MHIYFYTHYIFVYTNTQLKIYEIVCFKCAIQSKMKEEHNFRGSSIYNLGDLMDILKVIYTLKKYSLIRNDMLLENPVHDT